MCHRLTWTQEVYQASLAWIISSIDNLHIQENKIHDNSLKTKSEFIQTLDNVNQSQEISRNVKAKQFQEEVFFREEHETQL